MDALCPTIDAEPAADRTTREAASENDLVARWRRGDAAAFEELVNRQRWPAFALAYRLTRDREQAFDIVQESMVKLHRFLPRWDGRCRIQTWLYRVIHNHCTDLARRRGRILTMASVPDPDADDPAARPQTNPRQALMRKESAARVLAAVADLPERMQHCFRLRYLGELSVADIAKITGVAPGTVKATLHQARRKLQQALRQQGETSDE